MCTDVDKRHNSNGYGEVMIVWLELSFVGAKFRKFLNQGDQAPLFKSYAECDVS